MSNHVERGTEYELFVKQVYETIIRAEGVENVDVQHNIRLKGRSGCEHQIDVYWEFRLAGQIFRTAIECKAFDKTIQVGRIRDFYGVLADVPGLSGVFVTKKGYQRGAKLFGDHYGISLKEVRVPDNADWEGRVKDIKLNFMMQIPTLRNLKPHVTERSLAKQTEAVIKSGFLSDEPIIFDASGNAVASVDDLLATVPEHSESATDLSKVFSFPQHSFRTDAIDLEINGIEVFYELEVISETIHLRGDELVTAIMKDALSAELTVINKNGDIRTPI